MTSAPTTTRHPQSSSRTIPILRSAGLFLTVASGDGQRFADCFRQTLRGRLPRSAANELLHSWEQGPPEQVHQPTAELLPQLRRGIASSATATGWVWAAGGDRGQVFRFLARIADLIPSEILEGQLRSGDGGRVKGRRRAAKDERDDLDNTGLLAEQFRQVEEEERQRREARRRRGW
jgi:hypothetical protein